MLHLIIVLYEQVIYDLFESNVNSVQKDFTKIEQYLNYFKTMPILWEHLCSITTLLERVDKGMNACQSLTL